MTIGGAQSRNHDYCYDASRRLTAVRAGGCGGTILTHLSYDVQGNLASRGPQSYRFDFGNRLREVDGVERYRYDGHGRRVLAMNFASGTVLSQYGLDGRLLYQKSDRTGLQTDQIHLGGSLIAIRELPASGSGTAVVKYQHTDALGSPVVVTRQDRSIVEESEYEPYGQVLNRPMHDGPGYTGHVEDAATGLVYMQQRYYDPMIGVFLSVDPVTAYDSPVASFNRYRYANGNPYSLIDPDGRQACPSGERCLEGRSTRDAPPQPGPSDQRRSVDAQVVSAARQGSFSAGTRIDMSQQEQSFSVNETGTKAGIDEEQSCMRCGGENVLQMTFQIPRGDSAGHTHGGNREQKPGIDDAPGRVGDTRYVITKTNVMAVDRTVTGLRVRLLDGPMPRGRERRDIENRIEGWNRSRNTPTTCLPSTGC